jgi:uncharacterized membrane protein
MKRDTLIIAAVIAAMALAILGASIACTAFIAHGASMKWRLLFRLLCHGMPRRCLYLWGVPMPICARCTAIYAGALGSLLLFPLLPRVSEHVARLSMYVLATPMAIDGLTQMTTLRESTNPLRIATGLLAGAAFVFWALTAVQTHRSEAAEHVESIS